MTMSLRSIALALMMLALRPSHALPVDSNALVQVSITSSARVNGLNGNLAEHATHHAAAPADTKPRHRRQPRHRRHNASANMPRHALANITKHGTEGLEFCGRCFKNVDSKEHKCFAVNKATSTFFTSPTVYINSGGDEWSKDIVTMSGMTEADEAEKWQQVYCNNEDWPIKEADVLTTVCEGCCTWKNRNFYQNDGFRWAKKCATWKDGSPAKVQHLSCSDENGYDEKCEQKEILVGFGANGGGNTGE